MAKLRVTRHHGLCRIVISGALLAGDLRKLEQACGPELESPTTSVEIRLDRAVEMDEPARYFLAALRRRGAVIVD